MASVLYTVIISKSLFLQDYIGNDVRESTHGRLRPAKIQISLRIRAVWSESSLGAFWIAKEAEFLHADKEDSDQTARMRRLIWVFVWAQMLEDTFLDVTIRMFIEHEAKYRRAFYS